MMLLAVQTTLVLGIIQAVVAVPQNLQWQPHQQRPGLLQPFTASEQQNNFAGQCFEGRTWKKDCNDCMCTRGQIFCTSYACIPTNTAQINTASSSAQFGWTTTSNACILRNDDWTVNGLVTLDDCKRNCEGTTGCRSVEHNNEGICILSKSTSKSPNYQQKCPIPEGTWIFTERIALQSGDRNHQSSNQATKQDPLEQIGLTQSQQIGGSQANPAPSVVQQNTNTNQRPTVQQPGSSSSQHGRPQNQQNGVNQANAASVTDHFTSPTHRPTTQQAAHNGNQKGQTTRPATHPSSQGGSPQRPQSGFNPSNAASSSSQSSGTANGSPVSGPPGSSGATSGSTQQRAPQCFRTPSPGECRGAFPRFFYNETLDQCDCFLYGGCGNEALESSWLTNAECNDICSPRNVEEGPRCKLLPKQDIQTFTQASILPNVDSSNLSDGEFIDALNTSNNRKPHNNQSRKPNQG